MGMEKISITRRTRRTSISGVIFNELIGWGMVLKVRVSMRERMAIFSSSINATTYHHTRSKVSNALVRDWSCAHKKRGGSLRPLVRLGFSLAAIYSPLLKLRYFSLPTKPNLVTPLALMMLSTLAERS